MTIHESIKKAIPEALKAREELRLRTLRSIATAMTNEVVAKKRKPDEFLTDDEAMVVLKRAANQRKDSIEQFEKGGRPELAIPEKEELMILEAYLPTQLTREEIEEAVSAKMLEMNISSKSDANKLIGALMKDFKGQADGTVVKEVIDGLLS